MSKRFVILESASPIISERLTRLLDKPVYLNYTEGGIEIPEWVESDGVKLAGIGILVEPVTDEG